VDTIVEAHSQRLIPIICKNMQTIFKQETILFEPISPFPEGCLVARSVHLKSTDKLYCNVVNASDLSVTLKKNQILGKLTDAEIIHETFNNDVSNYTPLNINQIKQYPGKIYSSTPIANRKEKPPELTANDLLRHQLKRDINTLKIGKHLTQDQRELLF
jgi:hypothetical protein